MMRRPLDRRMFANPQQRRSAARMPQGILASGPRIMNAAMEQEPVRMAHGGYHSPAIGMGMSGIQDFFNTYVLGSNTQIGGSSSTDESVGLDPAPGPDTGSSSSAVPAVVPTGDMPGASDVPSTQAGDVNFSPELIGGAPYPQPGAVDSGTGRLKTPPPRTDDETETKGSSTTSLMKMLEDLRNRRSGDDKSTKKYVDEANALLKEFGIDAPDLKGRKDLRIMEFFLNMAAGQSPDFLTNVAQAGKESFKGYGEDVREIEAAEQKLKLAGLEMGMAEKARAEATEQAILFKEYDIAADAFEKIIDLPDKSQQIKVLMESHGVPQEDAIKMVYPGRAVSPQGYEIRRDDLIARGHSPAFATYMSIGGASLLTQIGEGGLIAENLIRVIGEDNLTQKDKDFLRPDQAPYRAGGG